MTRFGQRRSIPIFIGIGILLVALVVALNIGWIVISWREGLLLFVGVIVSLLLIAGVVLNTIFLVREIRRNEQQDSFLNAVTHELKTPVASIRLYLETLRARDVDEATRQEFYEMMLQDSERLQETIEQVLRAGAAGSSLKRRSFMQVDLAHLAGEAVHLCRRRYHLSEEQLGFENRCVTSGNAVVMGDPDELHTASVNLIDNAVKYSGKDIRITVVLQNDEDNHVLLRVSDHGLGISRSELKRIFRRFYRIPMPGGTRVKGTGLGLFIVRSVARRHGGRVTAESEGPGRGSIFTLELPLAAPHEAALEGEPAGEREPRENGVPEPEGAQVIDE